VVRFPAESPAGYAPFDSRSALQDARNGILTGLVVILNPHQKYLMTKTNAIWSLLVNAFSLDECEWQRGQEKKFSSKIE
jgi:hypothetical protein